MVPLLSLTIVKTCKDPMSSSPYSRLASSHVWELPASPSWVTTTAHRQCITLWVGNPTQLRHTRLSYMGSSNSKG